MEGLREGSLANLAEFVRREISAGPACLRLLYNSHVGFPERRYTAFNLQIRWIFLRTPIETLLVSLSTLDSSTLEARLLSKTLDQFGSLMRVKRMHDVKILKCLPSPTGLLVLSHMHGDNEAQMVRCIDIN